MHYYMHPVHVSHCHLCRSVMLVVLFFFFSLGRVSCLWTGELVPDCYLSFPGSVFIISLLGVCFTRTAIVCTVSCYAIHLHPLTGIGLNIDKSSSSVSVSVCLSLSVSVCLSVSLSVCLSVYLSVSLWYQRELHCKLSSYNYRLSLHYKLSPYYYYYDHISLCMLTGRAALQKTPYSYRLSLCVCQQGELHY